VWNLKIKNGRKTPTTPAGGQCGEIGRLVQAVPHYCLTSPTGSDTSWNEGDPLENPSGKGHAWFRFTNRSILLPEPPTIRSPTSRHWGSTGLHHHQLLGSLSGDGERIFTRWVIKGRPLWDSWRSHYQPLPGYWASSCSISVTIPFQIRLPLPQGPICLLGLGAGLQMTRVRWWSIHETRRKL